MSDKAFLDTNGLIHYNSNLMKSLNPSCEFKKGLISKSDLPCYTSNSKEEYNKTSAVFYDTESTSSEDFSFLKTNEQNNKDAYTVIFDGTIYENLYSRSYNGGFLLGLVDPDDANSYIFSFEYYNDGESHYSIFSTQNENVHNWEDRTDEKRGETAHNIKIYLKDSQNEYVHKLDSKYLNTSNGISGSDSGLTLGSQVYTYVNNQVAAMQTVLDTVESVLVTI